MAIHFDLAISLFFSEGETRGQTNGPVLQGFLTDLDDIIRPNDPYFLRKSCVVVRYVVPVWSLRLQWH